MGDRGRSGRTEPSPTNVLELPPVRSITGNIEHPQRVGNQPHAPALQVLVAAKYVVCPGGWYSDDESLRDHLADAVSHRPVTSGNGCSELLPRP